VPVPPEQQPLYLSPEAMAKQKQGTENIASNLQLQNAIKQIQDGPLSDEDKTTAIQALYRVNPNTLLGTTPKTYVGADGKPFTGIPLKNGKGIQNLSTGQTVTNATLQSATSSSLSALGLAAKAYFGKDLRDLTPSEAMQVMTKIRAEKREDSFLSQSNQLRNSILRLQFGYENAPYNMTSMGTQAITSIGQVKMMSQRVMSLFDQHPELKTDNNPIGQRLDAFVYRSLGIDPGELEEQLIQTVGMAEAYGMRGLMGGRPNMTLIQIIQQHLPQVTDAPQLIYKKMSNLMTLLPQMEQGIMDAEQKRRITPTGATGVPPAPGQPGSPAPAASPADSDKVYQKLFGKR
jgi:hypothetical protein